eukprot:scaffold5572_cov83-Skeletonema_dohrnii-CCMP3373.AAC.5
MHCSKLGSMWRLPLQRQSLSPSSSFMYLNSNVRARGVIFQRQIFVTGATQLFADGSNNNGVGKAGKGQGNAGKAVKVQGSAGKAGKGQGNAGGWPSTSDNPSGSGRSNAASKSSKAPSSLWERVRLLEEGSPQQKENLKKIERLEQEKNVLLKEKKALEKEKDVLLKEKKALEKGKKALQKNLNNRPNVPILFHGHYEFGPDNVEDLSRLISMHLMDKPSGIDRDRIYDCVSVCFNAAYNNGGLGWRNNPEYYGHDLSMLLATCLASEWFTDEQWDNIKIWNNWVRRSFDY